MSDDEDEPHIASIDRACAMAAELGRWDLIYEFKAADAAYWASLSVPDTLVDVNGRMMSTRDLRQHDRTQAAREIAAILALDGLTGLGHAKRLRGASAPPKDYNGFRIGDIVEWRLVPGGRAYVATLNADSTVDLQVDGRTVAMQIEPRSLRLFERYHLVTLDAVLRIRTLHDALRAFARGHRRLSAPEREERLGELRWEVDRLMEEFPGPLPPYMARARITPPAPPRGPADGAPPPKRRPRRGPGP